MACKQFVNIQESRLRPPVALVESPWVKVLYGLSLGAEIAPSWWDGISKTNVYKLLTSAA